MLSTFGWHYDSSSDPEPESSCPYGVTFPAHVLVRMVLTNGATTRLNFDACHRQVWWFRKRNLTMVIAVDPHKASWTAVVVTADLAAADAIRVEVNRDGYRKLRRFAAGWPDARWAIEGAAGLGAPLAAPGRDRGHRRSGETSSTGTTALDRSWPQK